VRLLFLDHGETFGGGQIMAQRLLPELRARGFTIDALVGCDKLEGDPVPTGYRGMRRAMRAGYDLIYANTPRTAIAAMSTNRPYVWHKHHAGMTWVQKSAAHRAARVISVCEFAAPEGDNVTIIPNGVPDMTAEPATDLPDGPKILMLGRMHPEKGHDVAIEALAKMQTRATLVVAGPDQPPVPGRANVELLGLRDDVPALLAACDVLAVPSRCDETGPLVVLEAQRAGLPIVASRVGAIPEHVIEDKTAFLVQPDDPLALARELDRALGVDRVQWAADARRHGEQFSLETCADRIAQVLRECQEGIAA
jgi:glycosyltransferase involved in cell wall biosynthesis